MMAPAATAPPTPAPTPHPTQRASAVEGAAINPSANAPVAATTVRNFVMGVSRASIRRTNNAALARFPAPDEPGSFKRDRANILVELRSDHHSPREFLRMP